MERLPRTTQFVSLLLVLITLAAWVSSTLAHTAHHRTGKPRRIQVYQGDDAMFRCPRKLKFEKSGFNHSSVEWYQNGSLVDRTIHGRLRFSIRRNTICIDNVHSEDDGVWGVRPRSRERNRNISAVESVSKFKSRTWCNFTLEVLEDPEVGELLPVSDGLQTEGKQSQQEFVGRSSSQTRPVHSFPKFRRLERKKEPQIIVKRTGETVALKCPTRDHRLYSTSVIDWRKNGEEIVQPKLEKSGRSLKLEAITKQDSGEYICVITDLNDQSLNFTFQLNVLDVPLKPKLLGMQNITVRIGDTARLNCSMASQDHRLSTVEWLRQATANNRSHGDSMPLHSSPYFEVLDVDYSGGKDRRILSIENVTHEDDGKYLCLVTNKYGTSVQSSWLIIDDGNQMESHHDWLTAQASTAVAVSGAIVITCIASLFILIRINYRTHAR
ncbi:fibroblast growth factor receptor 1-like [Daphnia pulicaria]|uniref:fibroblast growth factor receptor 1-like n=1 Tax=Daphnia pulicaria TaxID=35523 RepID=UPI001EEA5E5E|nr:fibroblast growth factor receptor 1-like [Daphnia pulicaria]